MILETIIEWVIPTMLGGFVTFVVYIRRWFKKANQILKSIPVCNEEMYDKIATIKEDLKELSVTVYANDLSVMWSQLKSKCDQVIRTKECSISTAECIKQLFERYKALNGNGSMHITVAEALSYCKEKGGK